MIRGHRDILTFTFFVFIASLVGAQEFDGKINPEEMKKLANQKLSHRFASTPNQDVFAVHSSSVQKYEPAIREPDQRNSPTR